MTTRADMLPSLARMAIAAGRMALHEPPGPLPHLEPEDACGLPAYAARHGMIAWLPLLYKVADIPASVQNDIDGHLHQHATRALHGTAELLEVVRLLHAADVPVVVLKGPAMSQWLYGDAGLRRFSDLDLLVTPSLRFRALEALRTMGFDRMLPPGGSRAAYEHLCAWPLKRQHGIGVDLHWRAAAKRAIAPLETDDILAGSVPLCIGGHSVRIPSPSHAAVLTLAHGAKHLWYAAENVLSIAFLACRSDVEWQEVFRAFDATGAVRSAAAGLLLAHELFDAAVPVPFVPSTQSTAVTELCALAYNALSLAPGVFPQRSLERSMHRLGFDRPLRRVMYDVRSALEPMPVDITWLPLPRWLTPLYPVVRVLRLTTREAARRM